MLDWGFVLAGHVEYRDRKTGRKLPLNDAHPLTDAADVEAVQVAVPFGVRVRAQAAAKGKTFAEELFPSEHPWEENCTVHTLVYDAPRHSYLLWYRTKRCFAFAESHDFKSWRKPMTTAEPYETQRETNILGVLNREELAQSDLRSVDEARLGYAGGFCRFPTDGSGASFRAVFLAHVKGNTDDYAMTSKRPLSAMTGPGSTVLFGAVSEDGVGWRVLPKPIMLHDADTLSVPAFDELSRTFRLYTRLYQHNRRTVAFSETTDFRNWPLPKNALVPGPDEHPSIDYYSSAFAPYPGFPQIRTMLCNVYNRATDRSEIRLATSRDGHTFHFLPGNPILSTNAAAGDESGFLAAYPGLVKTPDGRMLFFYDVHRTPHKFPRHRFGGSKHFAAWWRADRLAAIEAPEQGEFTLAPATLKLPRVVLNFQTERTGRVEVEVRDENFVPIPGRTFADCDPLFGDHTAEVVTWKGQSDLGPHVGKTVYVAFRLRAARLYSVTATD
jgi:hypothetical protein